MNTGLGRFEIITWQDRSRRRRPPTALLLAAALGGAALIVAARIGYLHKTELMSAVSLALMAPMATVTGITSLKAFFTWLKG